MRIIYMGSPEFSADILNELIHVHDVICVFTQPDKVRSRGKKVTPTPVKTLALDNGIDVYTPSSLNDKDVVTMISSLEPDAICVAAYGALLPKSILDIPKLGCFNVHASLLPRWRGAAPIERAILAGDETAGVCIMRMEEGLDTGDYCICRSIPIGDMNAYELREELALLGASALITALEQAQSGSIKWNHQKDDDATYASRIEKHELHLDPELPTIDNLRRVRASCSSYPAKTAIGDKSISVIRAHESESGTAIAKGTATVQDGNIVLGCIDGAIMLDVVKPDGKNEMQATNFLSGFRALQEKALRWE